VSQLSVRHPTSSRCTLKTTADRQFVAKVASRQVNVIVAGGVVATAPGVDQGGYIGAAFHGLRPSCFEMSAVSQALRPECNVGQLRDLG
jgi:hypothetical protein